MASLFDTVADAINDFVENGYDSPQRVDYWSHLIRQAALVEMGSDIEIAARLRGSLDDLFRRLVDNGELLRRHPGVSRFTLERVKPALRAELTRRIMAATDLIKLDRENAVGLMERRFRAWMTSLPVNGTNVKGVKVPINVNVRKSIASLPYYQRRLVIDQGAKFTANLSEILAVDGGALAAEWRHIAPRASYTPRPEHVARDRQWYLIKGSWAHQQGLVKPGRNGYWDDVPDKAGMLINCSCWIIWAHALRDLPDEMLTARGRAELARIRKAA